MEVCPTAVVLARAERIWDLLTDARNLAGWTGTTLVEAPARPLRAGDGLVLRVGFLHIRIETIEMRSPGHLVLDVRLPFGVTNREEIQITPIDPDSTRVTFN